MALPSRRNSRGFTLVELLIVVAIIGVLSTIGVPTFRKMVTKAKKSEAKVALGGLFTVESAFFTEYSTYGNHLDKVGFEIEGRQKLYSVGFPQGSCADDTVYKPVKTTSQGQSLDGLIVDYYQTSVLRTVRARGAATITGAGTSAAGSAACYMGSNPPLSTSGANATTRGDVGIDDDGSKFVASATGNIAPGVRSDAVFGGAGGQDVWVIDNSRALINIADGTN